MASYSVTTLTKEVRVCLDMNYSDTSLLDLGDPDTLELDELIKSKIADAARIVTSRALSNSLMQAKPFPAISHGLVALLESAADISNFLTIFYACYRSRCRTGARQYRSL